jgi:hypothetical protein
MNNIIKRYEELCLIPSDINEHLTTLKKYSEECDTVTEMGVRWIVSTWALLFGNPKKMTSIDLNHPSVFGGNIDDVYNAVKETSIDFTFIESDSLKINIEPCDLLFIDTWHDYLQLKQELTRHHNNVNKYIILHDTNTFGYEDEPLDWNNIEVIETNLPKGLCPAIDEFLMTNKDWILWERKPNNNGLTVLKKIN